MSIQIGDLDVANEIIELHFQVIKTQIILDKLLASNPNINLNLGGDMAVIENEAIKILQKKFPNMGIQKKF